MSSVNSESLVSIIMPAYNCEKTILASIKSVINQTYQNWELIVVDDCSQDSTKELVTSLTDERVLLITLEENSGSPAAPRNAALKQAKGDFIAFLDADDLWHPDKLQRQVSFMKSGDKLFSCTAYEIVDENLKKVSVYKPPKTITYKQLLANNSVGCLTAMLKRELLIGSFFPACGHEDYALWLKLIRKAEFIYGMQNELAVYRRVDGSVSSNKRKLVHFFWNIYRNEEGFSIVRSLYYCIRYLLNVVWFKYR